MHTSRSSSSLSASGAGTAAKASASRRCRFVPLGAASSAAAPGASFRFWPAACSHDGTFCFCCVAFIMMTQSHDLASNVRRRAHAPSAPVPFHRCNVQVSHVYWRPARDILRFWSLQINATKLADSTPMLLMKAAVQATAVVPGKEVQALHHEIRTEVAVS